MRVSHLFNLVAVLFTVGWLAAALAAVIPAFTRSPKHRWLAVIAGLFLVVGFGGFFGEMLSAEGAIKLPRSYEWPAGYVSGVMTTDDRKYIVPLEAMGRVQLYDSHWHFLCGWNVTASGGSFRVFPGPGHTVEVLTSRGSHHYSFSENGDLLSSTSYDRAFASLQEEGQRLVVPTPLLLWVFSGPFISWCVGVLGMLGLMAHEKLSAKARTSVQSASAGSSSA
jgi:hypothetical protein